MIRAFSPFKTSGTEMWPAKMCQWIASLILSAWASSATTASEGVPDTQSRKENETPRETAEELADTFPICQPEGDRILGGFGPPGGFLEIVPGCQGPWFSLEVDRSWAP